MDSIWKSSSLSECTSQKPPYPEWLQQSKRISLYKTELCRSFEETGYCRYGQKCQFAHNVSELRAVTRHPRYKTEICKTFWELGTCPYGKRCCFIHTESKGSSPIYRSNAASVTQLQNDNGNQSNRTNSESTAQKEEAKSYESPSNFSNFEIFRPEHHMMPVGSNSGKQPRKINFSIDSPESGPSSFESEIYQISGQAAIREASDNFLFTPRSTVPINLEHLKDPASWPKKIQAKNLLDDHLFSSEVDLNFSNKYRRSFDSASSFLASIRRQNSPQSNRIISSFSRPTDSPANFQHTLLADHIIDYSSKAPGAPLNLDERLPSDMIKMMDMLGI